MNSWSVIRLRVAGTYALACNQGGHLTYWTEAGAVADARQAWTTTVSQEAKDKAAVVNGRVPRRLTSEEFAAVTKHVPMTPPMRKALRAIMVDGKTWAKAASASKLTESGIKRALDRVQAGNV